MKIEDIITLINAGYSKADIDRMTLVETQDQARGQTQDQARDQTQDQTQDQTRDQTQDQTQDHTDQTIAQLLKQNNDLLNQLKKLQSQNAKSARQELSTPLSGADAIKNFITAQ